MGGSVLVSGCAVFEGVPSQLMILLGSLYYTLALFRCLMVAFIALVSAREVERLDVEAKGTSSVVLYRSSICHNNNLPPLLLLQTPELHRL